MKRHKLLFLLSIVFLFVLSASPVLADDFGWMKDFNIKAEADPSAFRARMTARFKINNAEFEVVLGNVGKPADAYILFRLGELSDKPIDFLLDKYKSEKGNGWGALAQALGIKPGSREFHALKSRDDLYDDRHNSKDKGKGKGKGINKGEDWK